MFANDRRKKGNGGKILFLLVLVAIGGAVAYLNNSTVFEKIKPIIEIEGNIHWNLKDNFKLKVSDDTGIKNYKAILSDGKNNIVLLNQTLDTPLKEVEVEIEPPKVGMFFEKSNISIIVEATDASKWNFLAGNSTTKTANVMIDNKKPTLVLVNHSYGITKGGSALVIFKASDESLDELYINTNFNKKFKAQKFYKDDYYISLVAWPVIENTFKATIIAKDKAGNSSKADINFYLKERSYKSSNIPLKDDFLEGPITDLFEEVNPPNVELHSSLEKFKYINDVLRKNNEDLIAKITSNVFVDEKISSFNLNPFYPLKNGAAVASFGDHRFFYYNEELMSESHHLGIDLASVGLAEITSNNLARVAYANFNGIYGKMPILYHGLGLYTLYGHCSEINFNANDLVKTDSVIARTGKSGLALGDHLHFGVLVQGIEVRPEEWMDEKWIRLNVKNVIEEAKKMVDKK